MLRTDKSDKPGKRQKRKQKQIKRTTNKQEIYRQLTRQNKKKNLQM